MATIKNHVRPVFAVAWLLAVIPILIAVVAMWGWVQRDGLEVPTNLENMPVLASDAQPPSYEFECEPFEDVSRDTRVEIRQKTMNDPEPCRHEINHAFSDDALLGALTAVLLAAIVFGIYTVYRDNPEVAGIIVNMLVVGTAVLSVIFWELGRSWLSDREVVWQLYLRGLIATLAAAASFIVTLVFLERKTTVKP